VIRTFAPSRRVMSLLIAAPFVAVACTSAAVEDTPTATAAATTEAIVAPAASLEAAVEEPADAAFAWLDLELTDAATGETFTLASLKGDIVAIEPMAIWCGNCKAQQDNVKEAYSDIEASGVRFISLGIDPGENPNSLAKYAERRGYDWTFVQSPKELSRAFSDLFGPQILSVPSTPLIVLDESGDVFTQKFGFHGPESLLGLHEEAGASLSKRSLRRSTE
jgi:cytochrome oxidase Cu insertion factor (SCO1/SenC/PrrC family)